MSYTLYQAQCLGLFNSSYSISFLFLLYKEKQENKSTFSLMMKRIIFSSFSTYWGWWRESRSTIWRTRFSLIHSWNSIEGSNQSRGDLIVMPKLTSWYSYGDWLIMQIIKIINLSLLEQNKTTSICVNGKDNGGDAVEGGSGRIM